jgi:methyltransferase
MLQAPLEDSRWLYTLVVALVACERAAELLIARRNHRWLAQQGAVERGAGHYPWMVLLHAVFLVASPLEVWLLDRPLLPWLAIPMTAALGAAMALRYWVVSTLGRRWSTRVVCLPGAPLIETGPYRWLRHPNYLAVVVEFLALPLIHTAWITAGLASLANAALLRLRIGVEEAALGRLASQQGGDGQ